MQPPCLAHGAVCFWQGYAADLFIRRRMRKADFMDSFSVFAGRAINLSPL